MNEDKGPVSVRWTYEKNQSTWRNLQGHLNNVQILQGYSSTRGQDWTQVSVTVSKRLCQLPPLWPPPPAIIPIHFQFNTSAMKSVLWNQLEYSDERIFTPSFCNKYKDGRYILQIKLILHTVITICLEVLILIVTGMDWDGGEDFSSVPDSEFSICLRISLHPTSKFKYHFPGEKETRKNWW